jgi:cytochrome c553
MKKLTVLSMIAAAFLLTACGDSATGAEAKAANEATETKTEAPMKCGEGKCGDAMKKDTATEAKEAVADAAEKVKEAAAEKASEAVAAVKETTTEAVDKVKETASAATAAVTEKATEAVAAVTGPDGKKLYASCAGCHGADGKTKAMGKAEPVGGQSAADLETKLKGYKAGTVNVVGMGMLMKGQVASMSDEEIKAVAEYMAGL